MEKTLLFYDIETTGLNKCFDQIVQFAAIRTNDQLEELARHEFLIQLNPDVIPSPEAFITHRIFPSSLKNGLTEIEAIQKIHALLNVPGTTSVGYNSLGFDDEFLRFSFYRNLLPPYTHQYANSCGRMDLYPMTVMYYLYKNHHLTWPENNLKLENLSHLNGLAKGRAHDAMVDVEACLNLARCLRADLSTWNYLAGYFDKQTDLARCEQIQQEKNIGIMIDGKFGHSQCYQTAVLPLGNHLHYRNQYLWLRLDTEQLTEMNVDNFKDRTWVMNKRLGEPAFLLPMKKRFMKDYMISIENNFNESWQWINNNNEILVAISQYYRNFTYPKIENLDISAGLYENGFLSTADEAICRKFHQSQPKDKVKLLQYFSKPYLTTLAIRILGRHYPEVLTGELKETFARDLEAIRTQSSPTVDYKGQKRLSTQLVLEQINRLHQSDQIDDVQRKILQALSDNFTLHKG